MKNINGVIEVTPLVRPDDKVVCLVTRPGNSHILNHFEIEGFTSAGFGQVVLNTPLVNSWDMGNWTLEVAQTDDEARVYVLGECKTTEISSYYIEIDERGKLHS